jgi:hypothetical protein
MSSVEKKKRMLQEIRVFKKNSHEGCDGLVKSIGCNSTVLLSSTAILYSDLNLELLVFD